jgi:HD-GYP domain-containing protein (c-di-GMP phosphodiesterase class II)
VAALLHDVGKIGVPDRILRKPGALTREEVEFMDQHSLIGSMMIAQHLPDLAEVREAVVSHHERWDGSGYPGRLHGTDIPLLGRILAVADAYSAMITDRPYRAALGHNEAIAQLVKGSGTQFDPGIVRVFVECLSAEAGTAPSRAAVRPR